MRYTTVGGGCFWCIEAAMKRVEGVDTVISGYAGGTTDDPSYEEVCSGTTGHAEVVQIRYDPQVVTYEELLRVFFAIHDPESENRQGPDVGSQYRSIILCHDDDQYATAANLIEELEDSQYDDIATELDYLDTFYPAEEKHQDFFEKRPNNPYCMMHAAPKIEKVYEHTDRDL